VNWVNFSEELLESKQPLEGLEITFEAYTNEDSWAKLRMVFPREWGGGDEKPVPVLAE
jgi:hypothetical protein